MARVIIDTHGTKYYYDDHKQIHREDGPAIIYQDGTYYHYRNNSPVNSEELGFPDRDPDGTFSWYVGDVALGKRTGPSYDRPNGYKRWFIKGKLEQQWPKL